MSSPRSARSRSGRARRDQQAGPKDAKATQRSTRGAAAQRRSADRRQQQRSAPNSPPNGPAAIDNVANCDAPMRTDVVVLDEEPAASAYSGARGATEEIDAKLEALRRGGAATVASPDAIAELLRNIGAKAPKVGGCAGADGAEPTKPEPRTFPLRPKHVLPLQPQQPRD